MRRVLILEPYYGGSHKHFLDGLQENIAAEYTLLALPARKWKMRMQLSAPWFLAKIEEMLPENRWFDTVLCSTFVDVGMLRALFSRVEGWNWNTRYLTYFHENQFAYPRRAGDNYFYQFTAINFNSALASDRLAFNSHFNRESFLKNCRKYVKSAVDMDLSWTVDTLHEKSDVLYPGLDFTAIDNLGSRPNNSVPVIVWNHRWEHDKNPEEFFNGLAELEDDGLDFKLILLGQSFLSRPECFEKGQTRFQKKIVHCGFAASYSEYVSLLQQGDIVVSTSLHEFYGIAVIEALRTGCVPVLPDRLSYPELFENKFLYSAGDFVKCLGNALHNRTRIDTLEAKNLTDKFSWKNLKGTYKEWLLNGS